MGSKDPLKILVLTDKADHASSDLRGLVPLAMLENAQLALVGVHNIHEVIDKANPENVDAENPNSRLREFARDISLCDLILIPQTTSLAWGKFMPAWQEAGKVVVMDTDDDIRYVSPLSPSYATRGTQEVWATVTLADGEKKRVALWKDGQVEGDVGQFGMGPKASKAPSVKFSIADNKMFQDIYLKALSTADAVTCPTQRYAETLRKEVNPNAFCLPNCVDTDLWKPGRHPGRGEGFRIAWHGGDSHRIDVMPAAEGVGAFLEKHPDATFVLIGANLTEWLSCVPPEQLEYWDWSSYDSHPWRLQALGIDVGLCPVIKHQFNDAKSPLKWEEFAALGVPSICSSNPPYSDAVRRGEDGLLVEHTAQEWEKGLEWLYQNPAERVALGVRARERIERDFDAAKCAVEWYELYRHLIDEKKSKQVIREVA